MDFLTIAYTIMGIIRGTPLWVWAIFAFLIYRGINALHTHVKSLWSILLLPAVFLSLAINSLVKSNCTTCHTLSMWLTALIAGIAVAWLMNDSLLIRADKRKYLIQLPGSKSALLLVISIFAIKYFFGYMAVTHADTCTTPLFIYIKLMLYGGISGLTIGKMLQYLYKYYHAESVNLIKKT